MASRDLKSLGQAKSTRVRKSDLPPFSGDSDGDSGRINSPCDCIPFQGVSRTRAPALPQTSSRGCRASISAGDGVILSGRKVKASWLWIVRLTGIHISFFDARRVKPAPTSCGKSIGGSDGPAPSGRMRSSPAANCQSGHLPRWFCVGCRRSISRLRIANWFAEPACPQKQQKNGIFGFFTQDFGQEL